MPGSYSKYYTGEAYWALARVHRLFPDEGWGAVADRIGDYLATRRDEVEGYWPPLADHWAAYGLAETVAFPDRDPERPLTDAELAHAKRQAALFGTQVRWISQQAGPWGTAVRGTFTPRGGGYGVVGEALTGLWRVAEADARMDGERGPIAERAQCVAGLAMDEQRVGARAASAARPDRVDGAWFVDDVTRMDDQQHAISALLRTVAIVEAAPSTDDDTAPSAWLWLVALVATLNPAYAAIGTPRRREPAGAPRSGRARWGDRVGPAARRGDRCRAVARPARRLPGGRPPRRRHRRRDRRGRPHGHPSPVARSPRCPDGERRSFPSASRSSPRRLPCCWRSARRPIVAWACSPPP